MKELSAFLILLALMLLPNISGAAQDQTKQWEVTDFTFKTRKVPAAPFEVHFGAIFLHENGRTMDIPGFYNGAKDYVIRFCPPETGTWTYTTYGSLPEFSGKKGSLEVRPSSKADEHGPLMISPENKRKLVYADGTPFFLMAFELDWLFALDAENPDDIPRTREIISAVKDNGFNKVVMNVFAYDAQWGERESIAPEHNFAKPGVFPFGGNNEDPDHSTLNVEYFQRLDRIMAHLDEQEIISHLMIYVWNKKVNWPEASSPEDNRYFDYVVKRYQAFPNLFWDISKEALGYGRNSMEYISERIHRLRKLDGHKRLLTVHDYSYCRNFPGKVDIIAIQAWEYDIYNGTRRVLEAHKDMPVFNIEHGGYEKTMHSIFDGAYNDALACLERNYHIIFAGAYSTYYWQNSSWYEVVWNPSSLDNDLKPRFDYYKHLAGLFKRYDFQSLSPKENQAGTAALTDGKNRHLFLLPPGMIGLKGTIKELSGKTVTLSWFNPLTGEYLSEGQKDIEYWLSILKPEEMDSPFCVAILEIME